MKRASTARILVIGAIATAAIAAPAGATGHRWRDPQLNVPSHTVTWVIRYRAHNGRARLAYVLLPRRYGPNANPPIPLVISPHGRGMTGRANAKLWGDLPAVGGFAVVNPDGEGRALGAYSWGAPGQIEDLARMPDILRRALPWLRIDRRRVYAFGGSMGGQETLLLLATRPRLLAGAAAFDSLVDLAHQYYQHPRPACMPACSRTLGTALGAALQRLERQEVGGDPSNDLHAYVERSPLTYARAIARSCVPLQLWWSRRDRIIADPNAQSKRLLRETRQFNPAAPIEGIEGTWVHTAEMRASARLPFALAHFGLLPATFDGSWGVDGATVTPPPADACTSR